MAVEEGNRSAALSFEKWKGRQPFFFKKKRVYLDFYLPVPKRIRVTSFSKDGQHVILCSYDLASEKPLRRIKLTRQELKNFECARIMR